MVAIEVGQQDRAIAWARPWVIRARWREGTRVNGLECRLNRWRGRASDSRALWAFGEWQPS